MFQLKHHDISNIKYALDEMPKRSLGKTGHDVCIFSLGGQATLEMHDREEQAVELINRALDLGVNYIDTAASYGEAGNGNEPGISETYIGKVMKNRRDETYLATKTQERSYDGSMRLLESSLKNLQTDHLDCWQLHSITSEDDVKEIFSKDGAIKALEKAKNEGVTKYLGITGHKDPILMAKMLDMYDFDTALMALNAADIHSNSFIENLLPKAVEKNVGIIGMKIVARGKIFRVGGIQSMDQAMGYVLSLPVSTVIIGISDILDLEENVKIAKDFEPFDESQMKEIENLTKDYYQDASWFKDW
jgi:hypothetical protein